MRMACSLKKRRSQPSVSTSWGSGVYEPPIMELQWPPTPVSTHTSNLRSNLMNQVPKDLHTARLIIEELRTKVRFQTEHILKWRKAYSLQMQFHYRYQREKSEHLNAVTSQLLLLESRLKRKQKQIANLLNHRDVTIQRQQKVIDTLSSRLIDNGLEAIESTSYITELDSLNDSDSAVVLEDIDSDNNMTMAIRRRSSGGCSLICSGGSNSDSGITIIRSISDAIDATNFNKYAGVRRNTCFLRRPDILETVYSVEEDPEPSSSNDVAEKRDKFKNRSDKALISSSSEGQIDDSSTATNENTKEFKHNCKEAIPLLKTDKDDNFNYKQILVPQLKMTTSLLEAEDRQSFSGLVAPSYKSPLTNYNRVMTNHRSVTKPKDVKYKRINKAKSRSLEELRGRLKSMVERGHGAGMLPHTAQSYA